MTKKRGFFRVFLLRFALLLCLYVWKESKGVGFLEYSEVCANYYAKVYRQLFYMLNDPFLAEDLAQEVFFKILSKSPRKGGKRRGMALPGGKKFGLQLPQGRRQQEKAGD